ncbi:MAG: hypothetical protein E6R04_07855 [Spirochaetes bacterium]|nr:MAG: hypothetical protein E6R04_07855 [Spirochaetota bacterium]
MMMMNKGEQLQIQLMNSDNQADVLSPGDLCKWEKVVDRCWVTRNSCRRLDPFEAYLEKVSVSRVAFSKNFVVTGIDMLDNGMVELTLLDPVVGVWYFCTRASQAIFTLTKVVTGK